MTKKSSSKTARGRRAQQRRQARTRLVIGITVGVLVLVGGLILLSNPFASPDVDASALDRYQGLTQTIDRSGAIGFAIGDPDAPVTIVEYSDFSCTHCADLSEIMHQIIDQYVHDGQVRLVYKPVTFVSPTYSTPAAYAAICAGQQGKFWEMHDQIWSVYRISTPTAYSARTFNPLAESLVADAAAYRSCISSADTAAEVDAVLAEASQLGVVGTPTVYVNGEQVGYTGADRYFGDLSSVIEILLGG